MKVSGSHRPRKNRAKRRARSSRLRSRRFATLTLALIAALALIAVGFLFYGNLIPTTPSQVVVIIANGAGENLHLGFEPSKITIVIGVNNTVIWKNEDSDWHTAHSNIPEFNSGLIQPGNSFTHTFQRAGTYPYHCDPHPWMTGVVIVKAATSTSLVVNWVYEQGQQPPHLGFDGMVMRSVKSEIAMKIASANTSANPNINCIRTLI